MKQKSWHLNRRDTLKGMGACLALPFLESMSWAKGATKNGVLPKRMVVSYFSYGAYMPGGQNGIQSLTGPHDPWSWWPCRDEGPLTFNKSSAPFEPLKDYVSYLEGLDHKGGWGMGGHSSGDVFATGADMAGNEKKNNISIDQVAAAALGHRTRHASLVLGTEGGTGYYGRAKTLSHYGPGRPIPSLSNPQQIFDRLFRPYAGKNMDQIRSAMECRTSVLDIVRDQSKSLNKRLGREDQEKMAEYLETIRSVEKRIERNQEWTHKPLPKVDADGLKLTATYKDPEDYIRCMYDLLYLALQTDLTRYATLMLESEHSVAHAIGNFSNTLFGYKGNTHDISHKRPDKFSGMWDHWRAVQHAYFLQRLKDTPEGDGNMLDRTLVLWGSAHPHAAHATKNYPIHLAGGNHLGFKHGNLHKFTGKKKKPLANLFVSMLNSVDVETAKFADSTGEMTELIG